MSGTIANWQFRFDDCNTIIGHPLRATTHVPQGSRPGRSSVGPAMSACLRGRSGQAPIFQLLLTPGSAADIVANPPDSAAAVERDGPALVRNRGAACRAGTQLAGNRARRMLTPLSLSAEQCLFCNARPLLVIANRHRDGSQPIFPPSRPPSQGDWRPQRTGLTTLTFRSSNNVYRVIKGVLKAGSR
jgi:hypothetical protein